MAYPTVSAPYGLKPVNSIDGKPYAGAFRQIPVAASFATAVFFGDTVQIDSTGYLVVSTATNSGNIVGVCVGGSYVNSSGQTVEGQYIPLPSAPRLTPLMRMLLMTSKHFSKWLLCLLALP